MTTQLWGHEGQPVWLPSLHDIGVAPCATGSLVLGADLQTIVAVDRRVHCRIHPCPRSIG